VCLLTGSWTPDLEKPSLRVFELADGAYTETAHVTATAAYRAQRPFVVEVVPANLVAKLGARR
jgi:hypothetical protein